MKMRVNFIKKIIIKFTRIFTWNPPLIDEKRHKQIYFHLLLRPPFLTRKLIVKFTRVCSWDPPRHHPPTRKLIVKFTRVFLRETASKLDYKFSRGRGGLWSHERTRVNFTIRFLVREGVSRVNMRVNCMMILLAISHGTHPPPTRKNHSKVYSHSHVGSTTH